jgi:hypothetical protein
MRILLSALALYTAVSLTSCVSSLKVEAESDKTADFKSYKTFSLLPWNNSVSATISESAKKALYQSVRTEMEKRGYTFQEKDGQLSVGISVLIEDKIEYRTDGTVNYNVGYGGYGYYGGYGVGYSAPVTVRSYEYQDGTVIVDVFDEARKNLIWQGYVYDRLSESAKKNRDKIPTYVRYVFSKYPVRPGK